MRVAWCRKPTDPDWQETLLTDKPEQIEAAVKWAKSRGYIVRIAEWDDDSKPDFVATIRR